MSRVLNIRGLSDETCRAFKSQAAARGETLSEYLTWLTGKQAEWGIDERSGE